nr:ATP-dependent DNA helicase PIF1-like [Tanacetum cinerariifolium]
MSYHGVLEALDIHNKRKLPGKQQVVELKSGGKDVNMAKDNKLQYIYAMADYKLNRQSMSTTKASPKSQMYLDDLEIGVTGFMIVMVGIIWDVNATTGRYLSTDFVICDSKDEFRILKNVPFIVEFDRETSVRKASVKSHGFIRYPFELVELENLEVTNNKYLIDKYVIGYVTNVGRTVQQRSGTRTLDFYLANSSSPTLMFSQAATFNCEVRIDKLRTKKGWNYPSCGGARCKKSIARQEGYFLCDSGERVVEYPVMRQRPAWWDVQQTQFWRLRNMYVLSVEIEDSNAESSFVVDTQSKTVDGGTSSKKKRNKRTNLIQRQIPSAPINPLSQFQKPHPKTVKAGAALTSAGTDISYHTLGPPSYECSNCHAIMWSEERSNKVRKAMNLPFSLCCQNATIYSIGESVGLIRNSLGISIHVASSSPCFALAGGPRYMMQNYHDAMAICRTYGNPDLFITFTSNPKWKEISDMLAYIPGQQPHDRPEVRTRVFKLKLTELLDDLQKKQIFGACCGEACKCKTATKIDDIISAELPSVTDDPEGYKVGTKYMLNEPCGTEGKYAPCTTEGKCTKWYPKAFYAETILDDDGRDEVKFPPATAKHNYIARFRKLASLAAKGRLTRSVRVNEYDENGESDTRNQDFNQWVLAVGDGMLPAKAKQGMPSHALCLKKELPIMLLKNVNPAKGLCNGTRLIITELEEFIIRAKILTGSHIVAETYPNFIERQHDDDYLKERAILTPRNDDVDKINAYMLDKLASSAVTYNSADEVCKASTENLKQQHLFLTEFLNTLNFPGMPSHALCLKKELPIMLLKNVNPAKGLCNGTRLIITELEEFIIRAKILTGSHVGKIVNIHRLILTSTQTKWPFILKRRQYPVKPCYAMTINKSQG